MRWCWSTFADESRWGSRLPMNSETHGPLMSCRITAYAFLLGVGSMLAAVFCATVTVAGNDYRGVLRLGLLFAALSATLLAFVFVRGSCSWRIAAVIWALPLVYVVTEASRRGGF